MSAKDDLTHRLDTGLREYESQKRPLLGIHAANRRDSFLGQLIESIRRIQYIFTINERENLSGLRADPSSELFDPLRAAILYKHQGYFDEAYWLVFLSVHFGKAKRTEWRLLQDVYCGVDRTKSWNWSRTSTDSEGFCNWLANQQVTWKSDGIVRRFGNHRKYQSLDAWSSNGTGAAIKSYVKWVNPSRGHQILVQDAQAQVGPDPRRLFDYLYRSMEAVVSFGRTAKFDYLTMVGKLGLATIEPGSTYMQGATGPLSGARLLFGGDLNAKLKGSDLDAWLVELETYLDLKFGMQVLEDALCNWQKSPGKFIPFRG